MNGFLTGVKKKLENPNFVDRAPKDVVDIQRKRQVELQEKGEKLQKMIDTLRG